MQPETQQEKAKITSVNGKCFSMSGFINQTRSFLKSALLK